MGLVPTPAAQSRENLELISDLCRFAEGLVTEAAVRKRWRLEEKDWIALNDDEVVRAVEEERVRRIRSGAAKREKAQLHVVRAPDVLERILSNERASPRHRIDAAKTLDDLAGFAPQRPGVEQDRVIIRIDLGADTRAKGLPSDPAEVVEIEAEVRPRAVDADWMGIDGPKRVEPLPQLVQQEVEEVVPLRRGPGRPRGSKNKPKTIDEHAPNVRGVPGFDVS
jgi:hypothetical protein